MKEYFLEAGKKVDLSKMKAGFISQDDYVAAHRNLPIACHDVFIEYKGGILTIIRDNEPMKGERWMIGGRIERGVTTEDSLKAKAKRECGLNLYDLKFLGSARVFNSADPFGHGKGTDCPVFVYFARGKGKLKLGHLHKKPEIVTPRDYASVRESFHPYMRDFMDEAMKLL